MSEINPQYRFGISIGVSHYLQEGLGKHPIFHAEEIGGELFSIAVDAEVESAIAKRILKLAAVEPPVLVIPELNLNYMHVQFIKADDGKESMLQKFIDIARVDGPLNAPELVGVDNDSEHFFALNRVDKIAKED